MAWIDQGIDYESGLRLWFNNDTGEMKYGQYNSSLPPDAYDTNGTMISTGYNPNMAVPDGGFTVGQALAPNYLSSGVDLSNPAALAAAVRDVAPKYNGPLDMNAQIPVDQMRAPAKGDAFENLLGMGAMAGLGYLSGGFGLADLWSNLGSGFDFGGFNSAGSDGLVGDGWGTDATTFSGTFDPTLPGTPPMPAPGMPPAIPETTQQLTEWGLKEVSPGVWSQPAMPDIQMSAGDWLKYGLGTLGSSLGGQIASGLGSSLTQQTGDSQSLMGLLGKLSPSLLGMYASNQQANKLSELAQKYQDFGAPYRQKLAEISADPNAFYNSEGAQKATDTVLRKLSIGGNPAGSANKQALTIDSLYDQYGKERDRLAGFGGLTNYNQAAPQLETQAIGANANMWNAAGAGLNDIFNPKTSLADLLKQGKIV